MEDRIAIVPAMRLMEGAKVVVHRTIGTPSLRTLDPFLMLDYFNSTRPGDYIAGFPDHPHRGFSTLTYLIEGHMLHRDSLGHEGDLVTGGAQWMKAARGVIHSEMPKQTEGRMSGFQLWVNLPAREKLSDPAYREILPDQMPLAALPEGEVRLIAGSWPSAGQEVRGPDLDPHTGFTCADILLPPGGSCEIPPGLLDGRSAFAFLVSGGARISDTVLAPETLGVLATGDSDPPSRRLVAGREGARIFFASGRPLKEPVAAYGPFVMNTKAQIEQAIDDYRSGRLTR
ncbi:MAG: pirin family protein [Leptospirillia bacterium]